MERSRAAKVYKNLVWQDPARMGGTACFYGTRVPIDSLYKFVAQGGNIEEFVDSFPTVSLALAKSVLEESEAAILEKLAAA